jgi:hypothetical protein
MPDDDYQELPPRPRRRLLTPIPIALLGVLLLACGFIGGVLVEKGQTPSSSGTNASGAASRLAGLRSSGSADPSGFAGRFGGLGGAGGATIGEVSYISGSTLYVTNAEGNTIKVTTSPAATITKTVKSDVHGIHPGETVVVRGTKGSGGAVSAESISVSAAGVGLGGGGGLGALFGGGSAGRGGAGGGGAGGGGLFGG